MHSYKKIAALKTSSWILGVLIVPLLALPALVLSQAHKVNATVDTSRIGAPISKYI